jgi:integrase
MARKRNPGLFKRGEIWHFDKCYRGRRFRGSTGEREYARAEEVLQKVLGDHFDQDVRGIRPTRTFGEAAARYITEFAHLASAEESERHLNILMPHIGDLPLHRVNMEALGKFIAERRAEGKAPKTINMSLERVRRILRLCANSWSDDNGLTWLEHAPHIEFEKNLDPRAPFPLPTKMLRLLFDELPEHLREMAEFKVNTGTRCREVCKLRWDWEFRVEGLDRPLFVIPATLVKNRRPRYVILNDVAWRIIERRRSLKRPEDTHVFLFDGHPIGTMNNSAWKKARVRAAGKHQRLTGYEAPPGFRSVRVHDLKHTFGMRLLAAGVSMELRQELLGHKVQSITSHYSSADILRLIEAANKASMAEPEMPVSLVLIRGGKRE